ncbi:hypothetical protein T07_13173 [Trichinella nelsoni]|uniref:Uncharacterized protein n=1 Tax=Trichinella nelsoni TaxID=6336 RepID=A0A0V0RAY6_9BILA|nr:hypothetical protein T07_13173 [Trichinella nelsoni]
MISIPENNFYHSIFYSNSSNNNSLTLSLINRALLLDVIH